MSRDFKREQPERFKRAVRASCGVRCYFPDCSCGGVSDIEQIINAWEMLPAPTQEAGGRT